MRQVKVQARKPMRSATSKVLKHIKGDHKTWKLQEKVAKKEDAEDKELAKKLKKKGKRHAKKKTAII